MARTPREEEDDAAMKVEVKNLRKEFGKTVAVDDISFSFDSGHIFGFVGPNGAGKTTTMRIVLGVLSPDRGEVRWAGVPLDFAARRRRIFGDYVFPENIVVEARKDSRY